MVPVVSTANIAEITANSALSGGLIHTDGGDRVTSRGICWDTDPYPNLTDTYTSDSSGPGAFDSSAKVSAA